MSPRAAERLVSLGFKDVSDYVDGKIDWLAAGLPTEGTNALKPRAGGVARKDVPTAGLIEKLGDVRSRAQAAGWDAAVVVNEDRVVFGLLRSKEMQGDPDQLMEKAMRPGPSTFRPHVSLHEMLHFMIDHNVDSSPITTSDGRLVGLLLQKDLVAEMQKNP
jgi:CBS domain-containing protein